MTNVFIRPSKKPRVLQLCEQPVRFTDLTRKAGISDRGLSEILKEFQRRGWVQKVEQGMLYQLTPAGRRQLKAETSRWRDMVRAIGRILDPAEE